MLYRYGSDQYDRDHSDITYLVKVCRLSISAPTSTPTNNMHI